jgi:hypothetical protein
MANRSLRTLAVTSSAVPGAFQLWFESLDDEGRGFGFRCDEKGRVDMDQLTERERLDYFFARALVGRDLQVPEVVGAMRPA